MIGVFGPPPPQTIKIKWTNKKSALMRFRCCTTVMDVVEPDTSAANNAFIGMFDSYNDPKRSQVDARKFSAMILRGCKDTEDLVVQFVFFVLELLTQQDTNFDLMFAVRCSRTYVCNPKNRPQTVLLQDIGNHNAPMLMLPPFPRSSTVPMILSNLAKPQMIVDDSIAQLVNAIFNRGRDIKSVLEEIQESCQGEFELSEVIVNWNKLNLKEKITKIGQTSPDQTLLRLILDNSKVKSIPSMTSSSEAIRCNPVGPYMFVRVHKKNVAQEKGHEVRVEGLGMPLRFSRTYRLVGGVFECGHSYASFIKTTHEGRQRWIFCQGDVIQPTERLGTDPVNGLLFVPSLLMYSTNHDLPFPSKKILSSDGGSGPAEAVIRLFLSMPEMQESMANL